MAPRKQPPGTVPIREQLRALGIPDSEITFDDQTGSVRVGSEVIQPEANIQGTTFADPDQVRAVVNRIRSLRPQQEVSDQIVLPDIQSIGQQLIGSALSLAPQIEQLRGSFAPTFNQELAAQSAAAELFNNLARTAGQFGNAPSNAPFFAEQLSPFAGRITEQRRSNQAQERLAAERNALARQQFEAQLAEQQAQLDAISALASQFPEEAQGIVSSLLQAGGSLRDLPALLESSGVIGSGIMDFLRQQMTLNPNMTEQEARENIESFIQANPNISQDELNQAINFARSLGKGRTGDGIIARIFGFDEAGKERANQFLDEMIWRNEDGSNVSGNPALLRLQESDVPESVRSLSSYLGVPIDPGADQGQGASTLSLMEIIQQLFDNAPTRSPQPPLSEQAAKVGVPTSLPNLFELFGGQIPYN